MKVLKLVAGMKKNGKLEINKEIDTNFNHLELVGIYEIAREKCKNKRAGLFILVASIRDTKLSLRMKSYITDLSFDIESLFDTLKKEEIKNINSILEVSKDE